MVEAPIRLIRKRPLTTIAVALVASVGVLYIILRLGAQWPDRYYVALAAQGEVDWDSQGKPVVRPGPGQEPVAYGIEEQFGVPGGNSGPYLFTFRLRHPWSGSVVMQGLGDAFGVKWTAATYLYAHGSLGHRYGEIVEVDGVRWLVMPRRDEPPL